MRRGRITGRQVKEMRNMQRRNKVRQGGRLKVLDWYAHQGHQYEFFKCNHDFYLVGTNSLPPDWNRDHRPLRSNVHLISEHQALRMKFDVVMVRSPLNIQRYKRFIQRGAIPVAVIQTTTAFHLPSQVNHVVWNSYEVMNKYSGRLGTRQNHYIVHGYDPNEFQDLHLDRNDKALVVANVFKGRADIMGYPLWQDLKKKVGKIDLLGHGNEDVRGALGQAETFEDLISTYNSYGALLNTTADSAMPRSRAEAAMCGMPIVSTNNFDVGRYFVHNKNAILSNDPSELADGLNKILASKAMQEDFGQRAREVAIKHFHIKDFLQKWEDLFARI
jgi:glycosyltransferase involved in cell wall biosynthesis